MRYQVLPELYIVHSSSVNCLSRERFLTIVQCLLIRKLGIIFFDRGTTCQVGQTRLLMDDIVWVTFNLQCFLPYLRVAHQLLLKTFFCSHYKYHYQIHVLKLYFDGMHHYYLACVSQPISSNHQLSLRRV